MRKRLRSTIKWAGTVLTVLLLVVWVGSAWWQITGFVSPTTIAGVNEGWVFYVTDTSGALSDSVAAGEWSPLMIRRKPRLGWWFTWYRGDMGGGIVRAHFGVPLWLAVLLIGAPTAWLWYRCWRYGPGLCGKCGYDLRGNTSGVCPECGAAAPGELKVQQMKTNA